MTPYQDVNALVMLYNLGDLPEDTKIFPYYTVPGKTVAWAHIDEIKRLATLGSVYPQSSNQKHNK